MEWQTSFLIAACLPVCLLQDFQLFSIITVPKLLLHETMITEFLVELVFLISSFYGKGKIILRLGWFLSYNGKVLVTSSVPLGSSGGRRVTASSCCGKKKKLFRSLVHLFLKKQVSYVTSGLKL